MPYIKSADREKYGRFLDELASECITTGQPGQVNAGDLNYIVTSLISKILEMKGLNYSNMNTVVGVLECLKLEFYRRMSFYEQEKILQNGDIPSYERMSNRMINNE